MSQPAKLVRKARAGRCGWQGLALLGSLVSVGQAAARSPRQPVIAPTATVSQRLASGVLALAGRDFPTAQREFEAAYRLAPSAEILYQLGIVAAAEGRLVEAHDLLRRYLAASPTQEPKSGRQADAERLLFQPLPASAMIRVTAEAGTLLLLDGRLVGQLPLLQPLLVSAGTHQLAVESPRGRVSAALSLRAGTAVEATLEPGGQALHIQPLPSVLPLVATPKAATDLDSALALRLTASLAKQPVASVDPSIWGRGGLLASCWPTRSCLLELALLPSAPDWLLFAELTATASGQRLRLSLLDVAGGSLLGSQESRSEAGNSDGLGQQLDELLGSLFAPASQPAKGRLLLTATPADTEVELDGWKLGRPPFDRPTASGEHELVLRATDYVSERRRVRVDPAMPLQLDVALALPARPPSFRRELRWQPTARPLARLLGGGGAIAAGATLLGLGGWALSLHGSCVDPPSGLAQSCAALYGTTGIGSGLVVGGLLLVAGGTALVAVPGGRRQVEVLVPVEPAAAATTTGHSIRPTSGKN